MTDDEAIKILTTDSFNDSPRRYYEALSLVINGFRHYSKIKEMIAEWDNISDRQTADASIVCYFSKILDVCKEALCQDR